MITITFKQFFRRLKKVEFHILIAIIGLTFAITNSLIFYKYLQDEFSFDKFHQNEEQIFRVLRVIFENDENHIKYQGAEYPIPLGPAISEYFSDVLYQSRFTESTAAVSLNESVFNETIHFADPDFFKIFSFPLKNTTSNDPIGNPDQVVISSKMSKKYFGEVDPVGKTINIKLGNSDKQFFITGILDEIPLNSTLQFDILINMMNFKELTGRSDVLENWMGIWGIPVYVLLKDSKLAPSVNKRFRDFTSQYFESDLEWFRKEKNWTSGNPFTFSLQPISDVHFSKGVYKSSGYTSIILFSVLILFTFLVAAISFGNILYIGIHKRKKEISLKKILGSPNWPLSVFVFVESFLYVLTTFILSIFIINWVLPLFNNITGKEFNIHSFFSTSVIVATAILLLFITVIPAIYPSLQAARFTSKSVFQSVPVFKNKLMKFLVVFQFIISVILIFSSILIGKQVDLIAHKDLGYNQNQLISIPIREANTQETRRFLTSFRNEALLNPNVINVTSCKSAFGLSVAPRDNSDNFTCHYNAVDQNFFKTIKAKVLNGRDFAPYVRHEQNYAIVNKKYVETYGLSSPLGMKISETVTNPDWIGNTDVKDLEIIGVVDDFNYGPLNYEIMPAIFYTDSASNYSRLLVRVNKNNVSTTIGFLENAWKQFRPDLPFDYYFLSDKIKSTYAMQLNFHNIILVETWIAVIISLFGMLAFFSAVFAGRVKDLVIRRVLGGSLFQIIKNEIKNFILLAILANLVALPIAYYLLKKIFENFSERIGFDPSVFAISIACSLIIVFIIIFYFSIKIVYLNIIKTLKVE